jgi:hypothetical protein
MPRRRPARPTNQHAPAAANEPGQRAKPSPAPVREVRRAKSSFKVPNIWANTTKEIKYTNDKKNQVSMLGDLFLQSQRYRWQNCEARRL